MLLLGAHTQPHCTLPACRCHVTHLPALLQGLQAWACLLQCQPVLQTRLPAGAVWRCLLQLLLRLLLLWGAA